MEDSLIDLLETEIKRKYVTKIEIPVSEYKKLKEISRKYSRLKRDYNNILNANIKLSDELRLIKIDNNINNNIENITEEELKDIFDYNWLDDEGE